MLLGRKKIENQIISWISEEESKLVLENKELEIELFNYLLSLKNNKILASKIFSILMDKIFLKKKTKEEEFEVFFEIEVFIKTRWPFLSANKICAQILTVWIIEIMSEFSLEDETFENTKIYKNRYLVINKLIDFLRKFLTFLNYKENSQIKVPNKIRDDFFKIMQILVNENVIESFNKTKNKKTEVYYINILNNNLSFYKNLKIFLQKPRLIYKNEIIFLGIHYSSIQYVIHKSHKTKKKLIFEHMNYLIKQNTLKYYINWDLYLQIKALLIEEYKEFNFKNENEINIQINSLKANKWMKGVDQKLSKLYIILMFFHIENYKNYLTNGFYFGYFLDFRGRVYSDSPIAPIGNKIFRYLYYYGSYSTEETNEFKKNNKSFDFYFLNKIVKSTNFKSIFLFVNVNDIYQAYCIETGFFEIGKIFKSEFLEKYKGRLSKENFIDIGIKKFNEYYDNKINDFEKKLDILAVLNIFIQNNNGNFFKQIVYKDATASAIQLLLLILGSRNKNKFYECNFLSKTHWYDTYYFIISKFIKIFLKNEKALLKYFSRAKLKKTIMTYNYEATLWRCWTEFKSDIGKSPANLQETFSAFYLYLENLFETNQYYQKPSKEIINFYKMMYKNENKIEYTTVDNLKIALEYYTYKTTRIQKKINGKRETIVWKDYTEILDELKTFRALRANIIHSLDGTLVRQITYKLKYPIITIHDSYGIGILEVDDFIKIVQLEYEYLNEHNNVLKENDFIKLNIVSKYILL